MSITKQKIAEAIKLGKVKDENTLATFVMTEEAKQKIDETVIKAEKKVEEGINIVEQKLENAIKIVKDSEINLDKVLNSLKGQKGDKGDSPTDEELLELIKPLIITPKDGHTPTDQELLDLIKPLIPKVKDGKDGVNGVDGISPDASEIALQAKNEALVELLPKIPTIEHIVEQMPMLGEEVRDSLEMLTGEDRLDASAIRGLDEKLIKLNKKPEFGGGSTARSFYQLLDVPVGGYVGQGGKIVKVKADASGLEYGLGGSGFNDTFITTDWVLNGDNYELVITHGLNNIYPISEVKDSGGTLLVDKVIVVDVNNIKLSVPAVPDLRFNGSIAITST